MTFARAQDHTPAAWDQDDTGNFNLTSTSFTQADPTVVRDFRAPTSGKVLVTVGGGVRDSSGAQRIFLAARVVENFDDRTLVLAPDEDTNGMCGGPQTVQFFFASRTSLLTGLQPGREYTARCMYRVDSGSTADLSARDILIEPVQ